MKSRNISQLVFWCLIFFLSSELIRAQDFNALFLRLSAGEEEHAVAEADYDGATAGLYSTSYTYDKMGNPLRVSRYGLGTVSGKLTVPSKRLVDNLYYSYTGHHIRGIADRAVGVVGDGALDFASGGTAEEYEYDSNGNLGYDPDRGMAFTYDRNNMPAAIYSSRVVGAKLGTMSKISSYSYDATGVRQSVVHTIPATASGVVGGSIVAGTPERTIRRDYVGPMILLDNAVERILIPGGYIDGEGRYRFYLTDYQGNNRAVVDQQGTVVQRTDYYPYGLPLRQTSPDAQPYKYSGKEFDPINGLNTYDFHARAYHPASILWQSSDKLNYKDPAISPWVAFRANPIRYVDPDGNTVWDYLSGFFRAVYDNILLGQTTVREDGQSSVTNSQDYNNGLNGGDAVSALIGTAEIIGGETMATVGAAEGVAGVALAPVSGGASLSVSGAGAGKTALGSAIAIHGSGMTAAATMNMASKKGHMSEPAVHGNSKASTKAQHLYDIYEIESNKTAKTGVSGGKISKGDKSYRATKQVNKLNKEAGYEKYDSRIVKKIPEGPNARAKILQAERERAQELGEELDPNIHKRPR